MPRFQLRNRNRKLEAENEAFRKKEADHLEAGREQFKAAWNRPGLRASKCTTHHYACNCRERFLCDLINDLSLVVGMYVNDYPFDDHHRIKHMDLIRRAHTAIGIPEKIEDILKLLDSPSDFPNDIRPDE